MNIQALARGQALPRSLLRVWVQRIYSWIVQGGVWELAEGFMMGNVALCCHGKVPVSLGAAGEHVGAAAAAPSLCSLLPG